MAFCTALSEAPVLQFITPSWTHSIKYSYWSARATVCLTFTSTTAQLNQRKSFRRMGKQVWLRLKHEMTSNSRTKYYNVSDANRCAIASLSHWRREYCSKSNSHLMMLIKVVITDCIQWSLSYQTCTWKCNSKHSQFPPPTCPLKGKQQRTLSKSTESWFVLNCPFITAIWVKIRWLVFYIPPKRDI